MLLILMTLGCNNALDTAQPLECVTPCASGGVTTCGELAASSEGVSCQALDLGVTVSDQTAYSFTVDGVPHPTTRENGHLYADCDGQAHLSTWTVDGEGCSSVTAQSYLCAALAVGVPFTGYSAGWSVEAVTEAGGVLLSGATVTQSGTLTATCPEGAETAWVVGVKQGG